jgi:hypothetical protein
MTNAVQFFFCRPQFPLYIHAPPHQARESLLRDLGGFFVAPRTTLLAAVCFWNLKDAYD